MVQATLSCLTSEYHSLDLEQLLALPTAHHQLKEPRIGWKRTQLRLVHALDYVTRVKNAHTLQFSIEVIHHSVSLHE